jgi:hypothetical protein
MRFILGMIIGSLLTIAGVYFMDARAKPPVAEGVEAERPMVNWDVVGKQVDELTADAQTIWNDFTREMTGPP